MKARRGRFNEQTEENMQARLLTNALLLHAVGISLVCVLARFDELDGFICVQINIYSVAEIEAAGGR